MSDEVIISRNDVLSLALGGPMPSKWSVECATDHDSELLNDRLPKVVELLCDLRCSLDEVAGWKDDYRGSAQRCGAYAYRMLKNNAEESLYNIDTDDALAICREFIELNGGDVS